MRALKAYLKKILPPSLISLYHLLLAWLGAVLYGRPARSLFVVGVTGTKGKTSVTELLGAILEEAGHTTALINSIRAKIGSESKETPYRMSTPGRLYIQSFLSKALKRGCSTAVLELTSEGARQSRHRFLDLDALIFTNLAPEHIESHGSYEAYAEAKFSIGRELERSKKRPRFIVANADDKESTRYLTLKVEEALPFSLGAQVPFESSPTGGFFTLEGERIELRLPGEFSLQNALAAATLGRGLGIATNTIARALGKMEGIPGRGESIDGGQNFTVIVDYAHTPDSLRALYKTYKNMRKICVLGSTGGGRDTWKRPIMGSIAEEQCDAVILTDEDPYDEDPKQIVSDVAHGMKKQPEIIMDRRAAIRRALEIAQPGDAVLITGKGTNHEICGPRGTVTPWSDKDVVLEELKALRKRAV